jgi:hypothetical protein
VKEIIKPALNGIPRIPNISDKTITCKNFTL